MSTDDRTQEARLNSILHPSTKAKIFTITLIFRYKISPSYKEAVEIARRNPTYREDGEGEWKRHITDFTPDDVDELFELFNIIHEWEDTEILVNHKALPYGHQLWLPLMWFYRIK
ncbi:MAG: hypothetical protein JXB26_19120 [Candidatus Aminicenantes bacterium]|nr:hypothetical protein [Candidatus Aminicenantes bacterium]